MTKRLTEFLSLSLILLAACSTPENIPPTATPLPVFTQTSVSTSTPTLTLTPLPTETPPPSRTPTPVAPVAPDWTGEWDVYLSSPILSIVKTIQFQVPVGDSLEIRAEWTEGTRPVSFDGLLSIDRRTMTGQFYNTDVDVYEFTIALAPDGLSFSGPMQGDAGTGAFCGTRAGLPRPNPCGELP